MTGTQNWRHDDANLASRLREIDPARGVTPLNEHRIEEIMTNITSHSTSEDAHASDRANPAARRRSLIVGGLATAAAAAAIVTAVVVAQPPAGNTLALSQPDGGGVATSCAPISAEFIALSDVAFEGRVTGIDGSTVTLEVLHQYTGDAASTVTVPQGTDELSELTIGRLETGGTYLISATDGLIAACGQSGPSSPELKELYEAAFS
jgi:hypothetical protein